MAKFRLELTADNAAFNPPTPEIARILGAFARGLKDNPDHLDRRANGGKFRDANGNTVGSWEWEPTD